MRRVIVWTDVGRGYSPTKSLTQQKKPLVNLESLARSYTEEAVRQVAAVLSNDVDTGRRLHAASILLDRGWGRPKQQQTTDVQGGLEIIIRDIAAEKAKKKMA